MRAHQLDADGVITNTIVVSALDALPRLVDASIGGQIGDKIIGGVLTAATAPGAVPEFVAMWQARDVLIESGLLAPVLAFFETLPEPARSRAKSKFEFSNTVRRDDPLLTQVVPALGKSFAEIDAMFIKASSLR